MHGKHECWPKKKGVSSLSNRKERRKWRDNTNQKARISATGNVLFFTETSSKWQKKCSKKLQRKKTIATIQINYNLEKT